MKDDADLVTQDILDEPSARGRKSAPAAQSREVTLNEAAVRADFDLVNDLGAQEQERVTALAEQLDYEGALTIGALEDGIRFYQRRTVEAILETGKRLLVLRELFPKGNSQIGKNAEFEARVELLGFSKSTAYRFMQAAGKTAKSLKLSVLSTQVKSASAFLELVTHDDDADLERLAELDDFDRMSASQVRTVLREMKAEKQADEQLIESKNKQIDRLQRDVKRIQALPPDEALALLKKEAAAMAADASGAVLGGLRQALLAVDGHGHERGQYNVFLAGLVGQVQQQLVQLRDEFNLPDVSSAHAQTLAAEMAEWDQE